MKINGFKNREGFEQIVTDPTKKIKYSDDSITEAGYLRIVLHDKGLTDEQIEFVVENFVPKKALQIESKLPDSIKLAAIKEVVSELYNLSYTKQIRAIELKHRFRAIVEPRQIAMMLACEFTKFTLSYIGDSFGGFDHATVLHASRTVKNIASSDKAYAERVEKARSYCKRRFVVLMEAAEKEQDKMRASKMTLEERIVQLEEALLKARRNEVPDSVPQA